MPWILLLISLLCAPLQAATIPGVTAATTTHTSAQTSEPDVEQKKKRPMARWPMCWRMMNHAKS